GAGGGGGSRTGGAAATAVAIRTTVPAAAGALACRAPAQKPEEGVPSGIDSRRRRALQRRIQESGRSPRYLRADIDDRGRVPALSQQFIELDTDWFRLVHGVRRLPYRAKAYVMTGSGQDARFLRRRRRSLPLPSPGRLL